MTVLQKDYIFRSINVLIESPQKLIDLMYENGYIVYTMTASGEFVYFLFKRIGATL